MDENPLIERLLRSTSSWPRLHRLLLTLPLLAATVTIAFAVWPAGSLWLAIGYFGALHRWVIDDGERPPLADAWICAIITFPAVLILARMMWTGPEVPNDISPAGRLWWPLAIVTVALALDRVRRPATPTEALGASLGDAGRRAQANRRRLES